jgi:cysteine synthase
VAWREGPGGARLALLEHALLVPIGHTPLVDLRRVPRAAGVRLFAKLESANPGGSVKDRAARGIVTRAVLAGALPGRRLLDASSGNTGIAYAMLGAARQTGARTVVTILPDGGDRYLSDGFWEAA